MVTSKAYWKDIRQSFSGSKGRVASIVSLMALGSFALVGLKVTSPDMKTTGQHFLQDHHTADLFVISDYGLDSEDTKLLNSVSDKAEIEYGYFKDVETTKGGQAFRIFSAPKELSTYEVVEGRMPKTDKEIVLSSQYQDDYKIGDTISFKENADSQGQKVLKEHDFKIVGFVNSSEILSRVNKGASTAGSGELEGYAVVPESTFDSDVYMVARLAYDNLEGLNPFDSTYLDRVKEDKEDLQDLLKDQPERRLEEVKSEAQSQIDQGQAQVASAKTQLTDAENQLNTSKPQLSQQEAQLAQAQGQLPAAALAEKTAQLNEAKATLSQKEAELNSQKATAESEIASKEAELTAAQERVDHLSTPSYQVYTRREIPGSEGYVAFENNASILSKVGNIFPVVLYLVAALVTFNTMARFVDEERLKAGTLRALGYDSKDVTRKFMIYGTVTGVLGTVIGTLLGHYLLPQILYSTYSQSLILAPIELHFYWKTALIALVLGLLATALPAYLVSRKELSERPAQLLLPKPLVSGSKILMERITPLWSRMSFTQKVTARNIFRYKQRMLMTIFGVAGSVALLFAGLGMRGSIQDLSTRQFSNIITYDMIVADNDYQTQAEKEAIQDKLDQSAVKSDMSVHYETVTKVAGQQGDAQSITLLSINPDDNKSLRDYINLRDAKTGKELDVTKDGVIISQKLAQLLDLSVGDTITVQDSNNQDIKMTISGITEMYMGHFMVMSDSYYDQVFDKTATDNAHMIRLKNSSMANTNKVAREFMDLSGVKGVVQNTSMKQQVKTIVNSLNRVMMILVVVSVLLAIVILYNLTNINVAERMRELSTIKVLGFHNKEVTMYIYRESIYLSLFGILAGFGLGYLLFRYMLVIIPPAFIFFNTAVAWAVYAAPTIVIILILIALGIFVNHWLRKVDMLEALKSVE